MSSQDGSSGTRLPPPIYINWVHDEHRWRVVAGGESYAVNPPLTVYAPTSFEMRVGRGWAVVHQAATLTMGDEPSLR